MNRAMKADLHVHSKYSLRPSYWILQKLGCAESYVEPKTIYAVAKKKGMDLVTITDHNTLSGSLEIAHLPDTFISEEITTYFPENGCKIHILALNIRESQHEDIQKIRKNIFELSAYLKIEKITHIVAHPLFSVNDRLTAELFEKLLLLFDTFEVNGTRDAYQNAILVDILNHLKKEYIERLADKHGIAPSSKTPWIKNLTGGSDDHSGFHIARTYTTVEGVGGITGFLSGINRHKSHASGALSHPRILAHALYSIAYQFYNSKFKLDRFQKKDPFISFVAHILGKPEKRDRTIRYAERPFSKKRQGIDEGAILEKELSNVCLKTAREVLGRFPEFKRMEKGEALTTSEKISLCYQFVDQSSDEILSRFFNTLMKKVYRGNIFDVFQMIGAGGALYTLLSPYFIAYKVFTKDRLFVKSVYRRVEITDCPEERLRVGHFTDTINDINGVSKTLKKQLEIAIKTGKEMVIITCGPEEDRPGFKSFEPIGSFEIPEYKEIELHYPPLLKMIDYCYEKDLNRIHIATPGPVGLGALAVARILQLPVYGTYHTAFPQYVKEITGDTGLEDLTWKYMVWFYNQMDRVFVPSHKIAEELVERGIKKEKIRFYSRGIDTEFFHPRKRNGFYKSRYHLPDKDLKVLYVGRVAKEKNLDQLYPVMKRIYGDHKNVHLVIVGDGPFLPELKKQLKDLPVIFTGYMNGEELSEVYASSDLFIFPSTTDTFGNVVLEAQASGLPVIVTDQGGPCENLIPDVTGYVVPAGDTFIFSETIKRLIENPARLSEMKIKARDYMASRSFESAFSLQWDMYREPITGFQEKTETPFYYH